MPATNRRALNPSPLASVEFEQLSRRPLTGEITGEIRPSRRAVRRPRGPVEPWLAGQLRTWPGAARARLCRALVRAGYAPAVLAEDAERPLLELGKLPFYRLDLYRHWLLAEGGADLFAALRQYSTHLDTYLDADSLPAG